MLGGMECIAATTYARQRYDSSKDQQYNDKGRTIVLLLLLVCVCLLKFLWLPNLTGNLLGRLVDFCAYTLLAISFLHILHFAEFVEV